MSVPKEITGYLLFSDEEPRIIGHLQIGGAHFEIAGIRRSVVRIDITGDKIEGDDENTSRSGERKCDLA
jgi:hypothetical protein